MELVHALGTRRQTLCNLSSVGVTFAYSSKAVTCVPCLKRIRPPGWPRRVGWDERGQAWKTAGKGKNKHIINAPLAEAHGREHGRAWVERTA